MKKYFPLLLASLLALPAVSYAGSEEFYTAIPATGSVAGKLDFDGTADGGYLNVDVSLVSSPGKHYAGPAGQFQGFFSVADALLAEKDNPGNLFFRFFCMDLYQPTTGTVTNYSASEYGNNTLRKLYDVAYPNEQLGDFFNGARTNFGKFAGNGGSYTAKDYSTAFQLAVWEIVYETSATHSLSSGILTDATTSNAHTIANQWLSQVDSYAGANYNNWHLYSFASPTNQDFVSARFEVPEPGTLLLAGLGLAGLVLTSRRRRAPFSRP